ncbi:extracellular solute-binding protein [Streptomyces tubercidicus]|uniref:extracellular solute-binding protein n=1 Tax=Streptomyces tubercidicus TaxID=47759 RepID=UPI003465BD66
MALSRRTLLAGGLAAGAGLTSGCAGKPVDTLLTQAAHVPRTPATLVWWVPEIPSRNGPVVADLIIRAFERRHPTLRVRKSNALSATDANRAAVTTQLAGAAPTPDVYLGDTTWPAQFGANSLALPVQTLLPKDFWADYPAALRRVSEYHGAVYALPFYTDSSFLFYRKDLLAKHGVPVPRTWEELVRTARRIQRAGDAAYGFLLLPWALINVVAAQLWGYLFNGTYGGLTWLFGQLLGHQPDILGQPASAMGAMVVVDAWKTTPFVAIVVLAGLMLIPGDVYEAAEIDGAGAWTTFWKVTLPQLRPIMAIAVLFRILQAFGIFDLPFVLTQGGPGTATESLAILGYKTLFQNLDIGRGAAVATTTAVIVIGCCLLFLRVFRTQADEGGRA